ncbi:MAG: hypothetical protein AAB849_00155 [Patescibacteria group bacterium]
METGAAIKRTLAFFDIFKHSLTNFELYQWLFSREKMELPDIIKAPKQSEIQEANGFFFLSSNPPDFYLRRQDRAISNDRKFVIARRAAQLISFVPFVRLVAICNTLSFEAAEKDSDIDFFIITRRGRIWLTRFLVSAILSVFNLRRHGYSVTDKICLSFFISDDNLNLKKVSLPVDSQGRPDIYLIYWLASLAPLINRSGALEKFWQANDWAFEYLANFEFGGKIKNFYEINIFSPAEKSRYLLERRLGGGTGDKLELFFKKIQLFKILRHKQSQYFAQGTAVVVNDSMLKFHEEDRRDFFRNKWAGYEQAG